MTSFLHTTATAALLGSLSLVGCKKDAPAPPPPMAGEPASSPQPMPEADTTPATHGVTVTTVDLGNAVDADKRVAVPMTAFGRNDTIYASVGTQVAGGAPPATSKLGARWTYQDGQVVDELSQEYRFAGSDNTVFQIGNPDGWPTGTYKVEILLDGNVVQTRQFEVR